MSTIYIAKSSYYPMYISDFSHDLLNGERGVISELKEDMVKVFFPSLNQTKEVGFFDDIRYLLSVHSIHKVARVNLMNFSPVQFLRRRH